MLHYTIVFLVIAVIAGVLGFGGMVRQRTETGQRMSHHELFRPPANP